MILEVNADALDDARRLREAGAVVIGTANITKIVEDAAILLDIIAGTDSSICRKAEERNYRVCVSQGLKKVSAEKMDMMIFPLFYGCTIPAKAGYTAITLPVGINDEWEPTVLMLVGRKYDELRLLQMTYVLESLLR